MRAGGRDEDANIDSALCHNKLQGSNMSRKKFSAFIVFLIFILSPIVWWKLKFDGWLYLTVGGPTSASAGVLSDIVYSLDSNSIDSIDFYNFKEKYPNSYSCLVNEKSFSKCASFHKNYHDYRLCQNWWMFPSCAIVNIDDAFLDSPILTAIAKAAQDVCGEITKLDTTDRTKEVYMRSIGCLSNRKEEIY